jgi:hypothetical protein
MSSETGEVTVITRDGSPSPSCTQCAAPERCAEPLIVKLWRRPDIAVGVIANAPAAASTLSANFRSYQV